MFHLLLGAFAVGASAVFIGIILIPLWFGPLLQLILSLFTAKKWPKAIPAALGAVMAVYTSFALSEEVNGPSGWFPLWGIVVYWIIYFLLVLAFHAMGSAVRRWWMNRRQNRQGG